MGKKTRKMYVLVEYEESTDKFTNVQAVTEHKDIAEFWADSSKKRGYNKIRKIG